MQSNVAGNNNGMIALFYGNFYSSSLADNLDSVVLSVS